MSTLTNTYVLITPAHNEETTIGGTIEAVAAQTIKPQRWIIVSDASTDGTDALVGKYCAQYPFIQLLRRERGRGRDFGSKVFAIRAGEEALTGESYDFIGNLDADITMQPDYFERLLAAFHEDPKLGIGGGVTFDFYEEKNHARHASSDSVGGAVQFFRRECYEAIGGYRPLAIGSEDALALHMARWKGWQTRAFRDLPVLHYRKTGTAAWSIWRTRFNQGVAQQFFGWSPWFIIVRAFYRVIERPYVLGSIVRTAGYVWARFQTPPLDLPKELLGYIRAEQNAKLRKVLLGRWTPWRGDAIPQTTIIQK